MVAMFVVFLFYDEIYFNLFGNLFFLLRFFFI